MISAWALVVYAPASSLFAKFGGLHRCCLKPGTSCLCRGFNCCQQMGSWRRWRKWKQTPPSLLEYHHQAQTFMFTNQAPMWSHAINSFCFSVLSLLLTIYIFIQYSQDQQQLLCFCCCMQEESSYICSSSSLPHQLEFFFIVYSSTKQRTCSPLISYVDVFGSFLVYVF